MFKICISNCYLWIFIVCALPLAACSAQHADLGSDEHDEILRKDIAQIESMYPQTDKKNADLEPAAGPYRLTLKKALHRGVLVNLDAHVAAMETLVEQGDISIEKLKALPSVTANGSFVGRSNDGATSSRSVLSNQQSLEPSQSTEENRRTAELELTWNLIDVALAISDSKTADEETEISRQRYAKVVQNIQRDVYSAYWRALAYQKHKKETKQLLDEADAQISNIKKAKSEKLISAKDASDKIDILARQQKELAEIENQLALSEIELKSLLSLPLDQEIVLSSDTENFRDKYRSLLSSDIDVLEWEALKGRPEMREEILKKNIAWRNTRREIIKTFPGLEFFLSGHYDSNQFLEDPNWGNYSAKILQSITALFTAPARHRKAKNEEALADGRRQALALAIMAQIRIAQNRLAFAEKMKGVSEEQRTAADRKAFSAQKEHLSGFLSGDELLGRRMERQVKALEMEFAEAQLQDAYAAFANTLGREISRVTPDRQGGRS